MEEAWDGLLVLDFEIQLSAQEDHRFLAWRGGIHLAYPRAALPRGPSVSPAPQEVGAVRGIQGLHTELLLPQHSQAKPRQML